MKIVAFLATTSLVQAGLASAIPAFEHNRFHDAKRDTAPVVVTETTTFYQTVVWVDRNGKPVSTEINDPPPGAATSLAASSSPSSVPSPPFGTIAGSDFGARKRPSMSRDPPPQSASPTIQKTSSLPSSEPQAEPSSTNIQPPQSSATGSPSSGGSDTVAPGGMGICYDMIDSSTNCKKPDTISAEFGFLRSQGYGMVRVYDVGCPIGDFIAAASSQGLKLMIGTNSIKPQDLDILIGMVNGNWGPVDTVYLGNELVQNGAASSGDVAAYVNTGRGILRAKGFNGNVVTVDTFFVMQNDPTICSTSDYCAANAHAFFDPNTSAENAGTSVLNSYAAVQATNPGKKVVITESGWPWKGSCNQKACPSVENQRTAMNSVIRAFADKPGNLYLFQAYNAGYKGPGAYGVEQFFGIYDSDHYAGGIGSSA
ncbi:Cell surface mannoprotein mp65 [Lithohypha guttulata]|uniref:Cell surface mannoprotein mp65 n=1 Tax=Lithohypha guttulata TaxID=1690604 RepID=A0AAN7SUS9_9EURO|nr:Cell surface mannoprotein mp65 [Lithohypha guttulata]KAK5082125.1 Cell surface mannoprotein mp65 [Lithohypha guttulata]